MHSVLGGRVQSGGRERAAMVIPGRRTLKEAESFLFFISHIMSSLGFYGYRYGTGTVWVRFRQRIDTLPLNIHFYASAAGAEQERRISQNKEKQETGRFIKCIPWMT